MSKNKISIFERIMIILTNPMIKFYNSKMIQQGGDIFIKAFTALSIFSVGSIYYFHFTKGIDYEPVQKFGKRTLLQDMYVKAPLSNEMHNNLQKYYAAVAPR